MASTRRCGRSVPSVAIRTSSRAVPVRTWDRRVGRRPGIRRRRLVGPPGYGLVRRRDYGEMPPRVDYELTELGKSLQKPINALADWALTNVAAIHEAQARFDVAQDRAEAA